MKNLYKLTASEIREKILNKEVKVEELVKETFERIEKVEGKVGSFVHLRKEKALEEAWWLYESSSLWWKRIVYWW